MALTKTEQQANRIKELDKALKTACDERMKLDVALIVEREERAREQIVRGRMSQQSSREIEHLSMALAHLTLTVEAGDSPKRALATAHDVLGF